MVKPKKKLTYKQMMTMIFMMQQQINQMKEQVTIGERALDEYVKMKGDKDAFVKHLEEKYKEPETDDKDNEKTESK
jgi:uncharacterized membrane protein YgaE (UPF0421/DUF939 family)|tara:strand:- start:6436 stop:6663 length:228 start_codon:yes stop_codon:yes gene_type:complete